MKRITALLMLTVLLIAVVPALALEFEGSNLKDGSTGVAVDSQIDLFFGSNVVNLRVKENNLKCFTLVDEQNQVVPIEVIMPDDQIEPDKKREITIKPISPLKSDTEYKLYISPELQAKNGSTLGKTVIISFTTASSQQSGYPITVIDSLGRKVIIDKPVNRFACGYSFAGHVVTLLGRADDLVAVTKGLQRDKVLTEMYPHIKNLPNPFSGETINIEELLTTGAELVFLKPDTAQNITVTEMLDRLGILYIAVDYNSMAGQLETINVIGKALGRVDEAERYAAYYLQTMAEIEKIAETIPDNRKVRIYHAVNEAVRTDTRDSLAGDWIQVTGAINVSIDADLSISDGKAFATLEQIYLWDPDIIIANEDGVPEYILNNEQWASLRAVKNNQVYQIPNGISRWGHENSLEVPLAALWTAKLVYPNYFGHIDIRSETKSFYANYFNIDLTDDEVDAILSGQGMREPKVK